MDLSLSATQRLKQRNGWLQVNGQFKQYGVDVPAFVASVAVIATAEALPPVVTPEPTATPMPTATQSPPLAGEAVSPLATPTSSTP